jgi:ABC-type Mn2+/Zn2+ transport system permease subunit
MKNYIKNKMKSSILYAKTFIKWLFLSVIMGVICGIAGTAFHYSVDFATT